MNYDQKYNMFKNHIWHIKQTLKKFNYILDDYFLEHYGIYLSQLSKQQLSQQNKTIEKNMKDLNKTLDSVFENMEDLRIILHKDMDCFKYLSCFEIMMDFEDLIWEIDDQLDIFDEMIMKLERVKS